MIPLKDDTPRYSVPVVTVLLIVVNTLVFFYQLSLGPRAGNRLVMLYGMVPARVEVALGGHSSIPIGTALEPYFTSMFLHGGWLHLIGNMLFLWIFGDNIEDAFGHFGYLIFYLSCGIFAGIVHTFFNWGSRMPAIGASGAIAGVMGAYIVFYPRAQVLTLVPLIIFFFTVRLPALLILGYWFVLQFLSGIGSLGVEQAGGVAVWAHVGGFLMGMLVAFIVHRPVRPRPAAQWSSPGY
ncbi:MAG TPA: rhomboid family intramembrane serine protease [Candidatus Acidoferrales bacterium]|nr:rhomboid family intramembrane serine protease [Candidatus Acidoferrales bacterium]